MAIFHSRVCILRPDQSGTVASVTTESPRDGYVASHQVDERPTSSSRTSGRKVYRGHPSTPGHWNRSLEVSFGRCGCCTSVLHRRSSADAYVKSQLVPVQRGVGQLAVPRLSGDQGGASPSRAPTGARCSARQKPDARETGEPAFDSRKEVKDYKPRVVSRIK
jgi:hypothetical protein